MKNLVIILLATVAVQAVHAQEGRIDELNQVLGSIPDQAFAQNEAHAQAVNLVQKGLRANLETCLVGGKLDFMTVQMPEYAKNNSCAAKIQEAIGAGLVRGEIQAVINSLEKERAAQRPRTTLK